MDAAPLTTCARCHIFFFSSLPLLAHAIAHAHSHTPFFLSPSAPHAHAQVATVFNDLHVLHINEAFRWEKLAPGGEPPPPRWRHTATLLPDNNSIFIFGGLCKGKRYNDTFMYDVAKNEWHLTEIAGTPPHPRSLRNVAAAVGASTHANAERVGASAIDEVARAHRARRRSPR